jgi:hypothetical protein
MDDATRRHWEQIADDTIDRAIAAAIADLKGPEPEAAAETMADALLAWCRRT